uniref:NADH-ubiquinone oxidoreductase chain 4L n=1 Tax=Eurythoe complanata TaxID=167815 RepID=A0A0S2N0G4_EURCO|nr:NADH dehydrogenase subunit 4L [Eurythoe complanata]ALO81720.1 NADH dehydrogenase subunit 4L [Eurythoe complanata]
MVSTSSGFLSLLLQRKHVLMALLSLEAIILSLTFLASAAFFNSLETFLAIVILSFGACEASLGLALLVLMLRATGSDMISTLSINKC